MNERGRFWRSFDSCPSCAEAMVERDPVKRVYRCGSYHSTRDEDFRKAVATVVGQYPVDWVIGEPRRTSIGSPEYMDSEAKQVRIYPSRDNIHRMAAQVLYSYVDAASETLKAMFSQNPTVLVRKVDLNPDNGLPYIEVDLGAYYEDYLGKTVAFPTHTDVALDDNGCPHFPEEAKELG